MKKIDHADDSLSITFESNPDLKILDKALAALRKRNPIIPDKELLRNPESKKW